MSELSDLLNADPRSVDKLLASELNSLSFLDREALSDEMHGVRSLAPSETPGMVARAMSDFEDEIETRMRCALTASSTLGRSISRYSNHNSDSIRREYLTGLVAALKETKGGDDRSEDENSNSNSNNNNNSNSNSNNNNNNNYHTKYAHALSNEFWIKFLRAELFDAKKAADRYVECIDFLVDYFGPKALERPLCLSDLDKEEMKLIKEGRLQLMPSRDRFGRRIVVFVGAYGKGYSHANRFRVCMYTVFQVASDDETTQRNGLVALYSHNESNVLDYLGLAMHQTESIRFFGAAPVRYSAVHCFLPDESSILRGFVANSVGKRTRLITRVHAVSSITETSYKLRCFGIPTEDFPVTSSGSIKTKKLMKWIKLRTALEEARQQKDAAADHESSSFSPSPILPIIECPQLDAVIFRNGGAAWDHPANIRFREVIAQKEQHREDQKTTAEKSEFLDGIITELLSSGLTFVSYNEARDWYEDVDDYHTLRKKIFQAIRDQSARRKRVGTGDESGRRRRAAAQQVTESSTSLFMELGNDYSSSCSTILLDYKRQKKSGGWNANSGVVRSDTVQSS